MGTASESGKLQFSAWEGEYQSAMSEGNPLRLGEKIYAAEKAMSKRLAEIKDAPANAAERSALTESLQALEKLQIKTFGYSDWHT